MKRLVAFGCAALVVAGCSDGGSSEPSAASVSVATVTDTIAATTTTPPSSTSTSTTIASTTTIPATTTTTVVVSTEDLIKQAVQDYFLAYHECGVAPATCVPETFTAAQGSARRILNDFVSGLLKEGLHFSADRRGQYVVPEIVNTASSTEATATYCVYDSGVVLGPEGPDGLPTIVNDVISSLRFTYDLYLESGTWLVGREHELDRLGEGNLCPPSA